MRFALLLIVLLSACGKQQDPQIIAVFQRSNEDMYQYRDRFVHYLQTANLTPDMTGLVFRRDGTLPGNIAGRCELTRDPLTLEIHERIVTVNPYWWDRFDRAQRENLIFHELGHCVLYRGHKDSLGEDGLPESIMFWQMFTGAYYASKYESFLTELFSASPGTFAGSVFDRDIFTLTDDGDMHGFEGLCGTEDD